MRWSGVACFRPPLRGRVRARAPQGGRKHGTLAPANSAGPLSPLYAPVRRKALVIQLIHWSLRHRILVLGGTLVFVALSVWGLRYFSIDAFPDTTPVQVQINTNAPALGSEEVERLITFPVEQAISGLPRLTQVRSISQFGLSQVVVTFEDGTDIYFARQLIAERLGKV